MRFLLLSLAVLLVTPACSPPSSSPSQSRRDKEIVVMAYYVPERDYQPEQLPLDQLTHIIFSFSNVIDGEMQFRGEEAGEKLRQLVAQKAQHPKLKVMIACGGWGADGFSDMAHTETNRQTFIQSTIEFVESYQLDGVDIDWEYPGIPAAGTKSRETDRENFTLLMKGLREALDSLDRPQTLTFASAGWQRYFNNVDAVDVMKYADYMNVMTYDQVGGNSSVTGHHTALGLIEEADLAGLPIMDTIEKRRPMMEKRGYHWAPRSVERIVGFIQELGVAPEQLVIGAAFYGRAWKGVSPQNNGLYQPNQGVHIGWSAYHQIREEFERKNGFERHWDPIALAPFLYRPTDSLFISYDDTASVQLKTQYAIDQGLGGIMFWELGNDTKASPTLLDAIDEVAGTSQRK